MARKDRTAAKIGKVILYRRDGQTIFAKWYNPERGGRGNYQRRSLKTADLREALRKAADLAGALRPGLTAPAHFDLFANNCDGNKKNMVMNKAAFTVNSYPHCFLI